MRRLIASVLLFTVFGSGCSAGLRTEASVIDQDFSATTQVVAGDQVTPSNTEVETGSTESSTASGQLALAPAAEPQLVATANAELAVFDAIAGNPVATLEALTAFGSATTLLVLERIDGWLEVALPIEPNGQTGWVTESDVTLARVDMRVEVSLAGRTITVYDEDEVILSSPVAVGSEANPTPVGTNLFITDVLDTQSSESPYGPFALGLSAHSETLSEFGGGDGQIGIHGTNNPSSIGQAVSHGCVRVPNDVVTKLAGLLPLGTPVRIV